MEMLRGVLWDLDGVIVDTGEFHFVAWEQTLAEYGIPFSREQFQATFGMNNRGILTTLMGHPPEGDLLVEIDWRKEENFRQAIRGRAELLPGVRAWLDWFAASNIRQAVASSAPQVNIDFLVDELGIRSYFRVLVSGGKLPGKPDPDVFLLAAQLIEAPPQGCLVIEDAVVGVEAAHRAGMKCVAVTTTNPAAALREADVVVERLDGLGVEVIEAMFGLRGR